MSVAMLAAAYLWIKAFHVVAVIAWMAGLLYLPRLFVYHAEVGPGTPQAETFEVMERRLYRGIMHPALALTAVTGGLLLVTPGAVDWSRGWLHLKLLLVVGLVAMHVACGMWRRSFVKGRNWHSPRFFRTVNELPTILMIGIVILAVAKPL